MKEETIRQQLTNTFHFLTVKTVNGIQIDDERIKKIAKHLREIDDTPIEDLR